MGYNTRNDEIHDNAVRIKRDWTLIIAMTLFTLLADVAAASARDIEVRCPSEGLFDAPPLIAGDIPNPAAGWQTFLEGKPHKVELSPPHTRDGFWLITCHINVGGALVEINAHLGSERKCSFSSRAVSALPNGGQACVIGAGPDSCLIVCH